MTENGSINVPAWDGRPREAGEVWTLREGAPVATCRFWTHVNSNGDDTAITAMRGFDLSIARDALEDIRDTPALALV